MSIKRMIQKVVEFLTGKKCKNCKHCKGLFCRSLKAEECNSSIFPIGWEKKEKGGASDE